MYVKKIHQFLSSIKKDAHRRKLVHFFLRHGGYTRMAAETSGTRGFSGWSALIDGML